MTTAEYMHMEMWHGFAAIFTVIDHDTVAIFQVKRLGNITGGQ